MNNLNHSQTLAARLFAAALLLACVGRALADVHYVDLDSTNAPKAIWACGRLAFIFAATWRESSKTTNN